MGVYHQFASDENQERLDPGDVEDMGIKKDSIPHPEHLIGQLLVFAMCYRWFGSPVRLVDDLACDPGYYDYKNVTEEVIKAYNKMYKTSIQFTGCRENEHATVYPQKPVARKENNPVFLDKLPDD